MSLNSSTSADISIVDCIQNVPLQTEAPSGPTNIIICRTCLTTEGHYISLDSLVQTVAGEQLTLEDCWRYCILPNDDSDDLMLPSYVCALCSNVLHTTYEFMKRAREAFTMFQQQKLQASEFMTEDDDAVSVGVLEWDGGEEQPTTAIAEAVAINTPSMAAIDWTHNVEQLAANNTVVEGIIVENHIVERLEMGTQTTSDVNEKICDIDKQLESEASDDTSLYEDDATDSRPRHKLSCRDTVDKVEINCEQCMRIFHNYFSYEEHLFEHRSMRPYACELCTLRLQTTKGILQHYIKAHNKDPTLDMLQPKDTKVVSADTPNSFEASDKYTCSKCSYESTSRSLMAAHINDEHDANDNIYIIKKLPYECPKCLRSFSSATKVRHHCNYEHSAISHSKSVKPRKTAICTKCGKHYERCKLKAHEDRCISQNSYQCKLCGGMYADRTALMAHKSDAHPTDPNAPTQANFKCDICGNTYGSRLQLRFHIKRHEARNFQCNQCNRTFIRLHDLQKHQLIHSGELPHKCDFCQSAFRYRHSLNAHKERMHMQISFKCRVANCEAEFKTRSQLNDHKYKHIGNPYKCALCPRNFMRREHFRRHTKAVHNVSMSEEALTKMFQQHMGRYNAHDIRKMSETVK